MSIVTKPIGSDTEPAEPPARAALEIDGRVVGRGSFAIIAGPCAVESREQTLETAHAVRDAGATLFRGGAYKPRTSPYAFQGLGRDGLRLLAEARAQTGLPIVTEVIDARELDDVLEVADVLQIGARNMQNYSLLTEVGRSGRAVLLKRGLSSTLDELLMAVPVLKERTHLPVIVDPSHAAGRRELVLPLSLAAAAAGADGIIVEVHPRPEHAICDGPQSLATEEFGGYVERVSAAAAIAGNTLWRSPTLLRAA
jgi:3-deoxy-7-phosphoheptulonate synthase